MTKVIGIIAIKGGVGKTTISTSLASELVNRFGKRVLLIDANYSAPNLGLHMDLVAPSNTIHDVLANKIRIKDAIVNKYGVDIIPGSYVSNERLNYLKLKDRIKRLKKKYDFVVIDSSPSLNEEVLSTMLASDSLFVVTTPDYPTLSCTLRAVKIAKNRGSPISGLIVNKVRNPRYEINVRDIEDAVGIPVVAKIKDDKKNVGALFTRIPMTVYDASSKFSREINKLAHALTGEDKKIGFFGKLFGNFGREAVNRQLLRKNFYNNQFDMSLNKGLDENVKQG